MEKLILGIVNGIGGILGLSMNMVIGLLQLVVNIVAAGGKLGHDTLIWVGKNRRAVEKMIGDLRVQLAEKRALLAANKESLKDLTDAKQIDRAIRNIARIENDILKVEAEFRKWNGLLDLILGKKPQ